MCVMRLRSVACLVVFMVATLAAPVAHAGELESQARTHYSAGKALYDLGNYSDALRELLAGYSLVPKPQFLLNLGQCYRRLDQPTKAKEMYEKYIATGNPDDETKEQLRRIIGELEKQIIAERKAAAAMSTAALAPSSLPVPDGPTTVKKKSGAIHLAWAIPVLLIAGGGAGVGIYFGTRPTCSASFGCISAGGN
jgi:tetratricopeptide (TPR) repeat protein